MKCPNCEKLERELLSAQAAIEKAKRSLRFDCLSFVASEIANELDEVDLSLLYQHDEKLCQAYVDALDCALLEIRRGKGKQALPAIMAALAQCKEKA